MTPKEYFTQDKATIGAAAVALAELAPAAMLAAALWLMGDDIVGHIRWFAGAALPGLLVVRAYAKHKQALAATKGAIVALFVTFVAFIFCLIKLKAL